MPLIFNKATGKPENVSDADAQAGLQSGAYEYPLLDDSGTTVSAPASEVQGLLGRGYTVPDSKALQGIVDYEKFNRPEQQVAAFAEGAASGLTFGLSSLVQQGLGADAENMRKRREYNPGLNIAGQVGSLLTGVGAAGLATKAGAAAAAQIGGTSLASKLGASAAAAAVENAALQAGDEVSKLLTYDPNQNLSSAVANIGLAAALGGVAGGGLGAVDEVWRAYKPKQVKDTLDAILTPPDNQIADAAGIDLAPEIYAAVGSNPKLKDAAEHLLNNSGKSAQEFQASLAAAKTSIDDAVLSTLGKTVDDVDNLKDASKAAIGREYAESLVKTIDEQAAPIAQKYEEFTSKFRSTALDEADKLNIIDNVGQLIAKEGLAKGPNEAALKLAQKVIDQMPAQETVADLVNYVKNIPYNPETYGVARQLKQIIGGAEDAALSKAAAATGDNVFQEFQQLQKAYGPYKQTLTELGDKIGVKLKAGEGANKLIQKINQKAKTSPELFAKKLELADDVGLQELLQTSFPSLLEQASGNQLNQLISKSISKEGAFDASKFYTQLGKLNPEARATLAAPEALEKLSSIEKLLVNLPQRTNTSRTGGVVNEQLKAAMRTVGGLAGLATGGLDGLALYGLSKAITEAPEATRLAMLKAAGNSNAFSAVGLKATAKMFNAVIEGTKRTTKAINAIFKGSATLAVKDYVNTRDLKLLDEKVSEYSKLPEKFISMGNDLQHYTPEYANALSTSSLSAVNYLMSLKPKDVQYAPLDEPSKPNKVEQARYERALAIGQNPLVTLAMLKNGTLTQESMLDLQAMHPNFRQDVTFKLQEQLLNKKATDIPYVQKRMLSLFMGAPLDSSLMPAFAPVQSNAQPAIPSAGKPIKLSDNIAKGAQTAEQARLSK